MKDTNAAHNTRMVGNELNKPLAQIPTVGEMYRAMTFPFFEMKWCKILQTQAGRGP